MNREQAIQLYRMIQTSQREYADAKRADDAGKWDDMRAASHRFHAVDQEIQRTLNAMWEDES